jgi:ATP-binding cassette, subfamily B, bacterial
MRLDKLLKSKIQKASRFLPALRLVWQSSPGWTIARIVILIILGILPLISIYLAKLIVDTVTMGLMATDKTATFSEILKLLLLAGVVTVINGLCTSLSEFVNTAHSLRVTDYMQGIMHAKSIEADLEYYENAKYFDALQRAQQEAPYRPPQILNRLAQVGQNGISLITMVGLLSSLHWGIIGVLMVAALPAVFVRVQQSRIMYQWQRKRTGMDRQSMYLGFMLTGDLFAKEIRLFGLGSFFSAWYLRIRQQLYEERLDISKRKALANFLAQGFAGILIFAIYSFIIYQTLQGVLRLGDLVLYYQALQRGQLNINGLLTGVSGLYEDNLFLTNLYEFLDLKPTIVDPIDPKPFPETIKTGIVFNQVSFQYSNSTRQALSNINLCIEPGKTIALVGENGCGKTTLIKLLCRLYDPTSGSITIDGIDIREFEITDLRRQVGVIFQDYAKYNLTAFENIWLGNVEVPREDEKIIAAAHRSGADEVIQQLPQGYDTVLGKLFDQGEELSIGQWQKIALARAFLRSSQLIILDEPTSAMDPKAEYEVFNQFRQLIKDQAAILITHRLSTVKMADCIYVMDQGSIVESGTHDQLMQQRGSYAHLFETQAQNYR